MEMTGDKKISGLKNGLVGKNENIVFVKMWILWKTNSS